MDFTPNQTFPHGFGERIVGNTCGIDLGQDAVFLPVLYGIFFTVGIPLNVLSLYGLHRLIKSENVLPVYVINLLLSDLLQLLTLPLWIDYYSSEHTWHYGPKACQAMGLIFYISLYASIFFMCVIALERYLAIARPFKFQAVRKLKCACLASLALWTVVALPPVVAINTLFPTSENYTLCIEKYPSTEGFITYRLITLFLSFILPLSFILSLHGKTLRALTGVGSLVEGEKRRIRGLLTLLVVIFVLVQGPYHFIGCLKYLGLLIHPVVCQWEKVVFMPYQLGRGLISLNSLLDPVLYIFMRSDFREAVCKYLPCLRRVQWFMSQEMSSGVSDQGDRPTNST